MNYQMIENELLPIYENEKREKLVNARELFYSLRGQDTKTKFVDWINEKITKYEFEENVDFISFSQKNEKPFGGRPTKEYMLRIDTAKEIAMIENNEIGRKIRRYFIEVEKRYRIIVETPQNIFDFMRLALDQMEANEKEINHVKLMTQDNTKQIQDIQAKIDVTIKKQYCLGSDIAEQLKVYSESGLPHANLIGAIARQLGYKTSYKHYYEDEYIAIVPDISKGNDFWQVYYKPTAVNAILDWFHEKKEEMEYTIVYQKNTKNGTKGKIKEKGFKIDGICYKINATNE